MRTPPTQAQPLSEKRLASSEIELPRRRGRYSSGPTVHHRRSNEPTADQPVDVAGPVRVLTGMVGRRRAADPLRLLSGADLARRGGRGCGGNLNKALARASRTRDPPASRGVRWAAAAGKTA